MACAVPPGVPGVARSMSSDSCPPGTGAARSREIRASPESAVGGQQVDPAAGQQVGRAVLPSGLQGETPDGQHGHADRRG